MQISSTYCHVHGCFTLFCTNLCTWMWLCMPALWELRTLTHNLNYILQWGMYYLYKNACVTRALSVHDVYNRKSELLGDSVVELTADKNWLPQRYDLILNRAKFHEHTQIYFKTANIGNKILKSASIGIIYLHYFVFHHI